MNWIRVTRPERGMRMEKSGRKGPMHGIVIVELASHAFVPSCCACLADWGARVIKLEQHPFGDPSRAVISSGLIPLMDVNYYWEWCNRGKESFGIDMKKEGAKEVAYELIGKADIFATNLRRSSLAKLGLDAKSLFKINSKLVIARATGFGDKGPESENPGFDFAAFWARSGIADTFSEPGRPVLTQPPAVGDFISGLYLAAGVAAALCARYGTGKGQEVSLSLLAAGIYSSALSAQFSLASGIEAQKIPREKVPNPLWNSYQTSDGRWIQLAMLETEQYWDGFCNAVGITDLKTDVRFNSHMRRTENNISLISILDKVFASKPFKEWVAALGKSRLIWAPFQKAYEVFDDVQVLANEYVDTVADADYKMKKFITTPIQFNGKPTKVNRPAPTVGQHTEEVLVEMGWDWDNILRLKEKGTII
ncbi:CaiB/BaiF CoA transferase family protein [Chloroflexota bacterium]